jgi:hypothetical protein
VPTLTIRFPTGVLFDVMMRGGPLPARYQSIGVSPPPLDFTPEEAIALRDWLALQPEGFIDLRDRQGAIGVVDQALRISKLCTGCGAGLEPDEVVRGHRCRHCATSPAD